MTRPDLRRALVPLVLLLAACGSTPPAREVPLRVLIYNIHAGKDSAGAGNLERVAGLIASTRADLVLLQEVDRDTVRSGRVDQLAELERRTGLHGIFGKSLDYQGGEYGIAVLSRWPITASEVVPLRVDPPQERADGSVEPRIALIVETQPPFGTLRAVNTHLDASRRDVYRLQEVATLLETLQSWRDGALLLVGGDFNAEPGSGVHERLSEAGLHDAWASCGRGDGLTFPAAAPVKRIDYGFLADPALCRSASVLESAASDHRPLLVEIEPLTTSSSRRLRGSTSSSSSSISSRTRSSSAR